MKRRKPRKLYTFEEWFKYMHYTITFLRLVYYKRSYIRYLQKTLPRLKLRKSGVSNSQYNSIKNMIDSKDLEAIQMGVMVVNEILNRKYGRK